MARFYDRSDIYTFDGHYINDEIFSLLSFSLYTRRFVTKARNKNRALLSLALLRGTHPLKICPLLNPSRRNERIVLLIAISTRVPRLDMCTVLVFDTVLKIVLRIGHALKEAEESMIFDWYDMRHMTSFILLLFVLKKIIK